MKANIVDLCDIKWLVIFVSSYGCALQADELNLNFIHGVKRAPAILTNSSEYPSGQYFVDVIVNKERMQRVPLQISHEEEISNSLCLSPQWLAQAGVLFNPELYTSVYNKAEHCYILSKEFNTKVNFNYNTQTLEFSIPQAYMLSKADPRRWEYGVNGVRLKYYGNFNTSAENSLNAYGNTDLSVNIGRWILSNNLNVSYLNEKTDISSSDVTLSTAISQIQGDLLLGKSQTRAGLFSDFNFYGVSLRSNSNMLPWEQRGYAPIISGVANGTSRITVKQNGYTIYSEVVSPGPYQLDNLRPVGNGELEVTVEDELGHKTITNYPVSTLPALLRPGQLQYNTAIGKKNTENKLIKSLNSNDGLFLLGSVDYGLATTTLSGAVILHQNYQNFGIGLAQSLGMWGALSVSALSSNSEYNDGTRKAGKSYSAKYAKNITDKTDIQLLTYRHQTPGYIEFANFDSANYYNNFNSNGSPKSRYEARLSHRVDRSYITGTYWTQDYWAQNNSDHGATLGLNTYFKGMTIFLNGSYAKRGNNKVAEDYSATLGVSLPFVIFNGASYAANSSVSYSNGETLLNTGLSSTVSERFNYSVNANVNSKGVSGASASAGYAFDALQTNVAISQSNGHTSLSGNLSGSVVGTKETGVIFSKDSSTTIGIIRAPGIEGIKFNNSLPTNNKGNTIVWLNEYAENTININMDNVPDNVEFTNTSFKVVPTAGAIIYREFAFENLLRYIVRVRDTQGKIISGASAKTEQQVDAGFIANNGVLLINMLSAPKLITVDQGDGKTCQFSMKNMKANTNMVNEVVCE